MTVMLEARGLAKAFHSIAAVKGVSFTVERGEVLGFLGPNGAGKSTTMKMLTGFLRPNAGTAIICGQEMEANPIAAKKHLGYLPEGAPVYGDMTCLEFLKFIADVRGFKGNEARDAIDRAVALTHLTLVLDQPIETLSKGFKRRVGLAQAILHDPDVLVLDEPTDGLDPNQKHEIRNLILSMSRDKAIVISTHILEEVEAVCSRAIVIDRGLIVADATPAILREKSRYHNAVSLMIEGSGEKAITQGLRKIDGVLSVEIKKIGGGFTEITAFANSGSHILDDVSRAIEANGWTVREIAVDPGRLDDVFRTLTTGEATDEAMEPLNGTAGEAK
jgi:ABC-2 type transport system ATP-binding protein